MVMQSTPPEIWDLEYLPPWLAGEAKCSRKIIGTLRKQNGNATTTAINTMKFIILYKRDE